MGISPAQLEVLARCDPCVGTLRFGIASFARSRVVNITGPGGKMLLTTFAEPSPTRVVSIPLRFSRRIRVDISTIPGPDSIRKATGVDDPRSVSIYVQNPVFVESKR
jgi:hypothetical protein